MTTIEIKIHSSDNRPINIEPIQIQVSAEFAQRLNHYRHALMRILTFGLRFVEQNIVPKAIDTQHDTETSLAVSSADDALSPEDEQEHVRQILREAGLLTELGPELKKRAESSTATLEEVRAIFDRVGGPSLSEIVLEQRRSKPW